MTAPPRLPAARGAASRRRRRVVVLMDVIGGDRTFSERDLDDLVSWKCDFIDRPGSQVDSVWWEWGEGNQAPWPSRTLPLYDQEGYRRWAAAGVDIVQAFLDAARARGLESLYAYRINGSDNDLGTVDRIPMKAAHPDWLQHTWADSNGFWDFAIEGVRRYKLEILGEIVSRWEMDGIALDFARVCPVLRVGRQWPLREGLTEFMRGVRALADAAAAERGRPYLVAARIPENVLGCHYDGIDVEAWCREGLVDVFALGVRSFDVEVETFRRLAGPDVALYPSIDDHHASDGYQGAPIEVYRGAAARWFHQGADGVQLFNFYHAERGFDAPEVATHLRAHLELGDAAGLVGRDKVYLVQRRGGGHGPTVVPNPEDWWTPRWMYFNTNMFSPLPAEVPNDGRTDALLTVAVADDLSAHPPAAVEVRLLLSDPGAAGLGDGERLEAVTVAAQAHFPPLRSQPPARGLAAWIDLRVNGVLLRPARAESGWLVFAAAPEAFAVGDNLVGVLARGRQGQAERLRLEKLEVHVRYGR